MRTRLFTVFTCTDVQLHFHIRWCSCRWTVTRQVSLLKQELSTILDHLGSAFPMLPLFSGVPIVHVCCLSRCLYCFFYPLYWLSFFYLLLLVTPLVSCYPFGILLPLWYLVTSLVSCYPFRILLHLWYLVALLISCYPFGILLPLWYFWYFVTPLVSCYPFGILLPL